MAMEDLPRNYDAIILGTGMPESILAAALARIGMKVLHLDRNDYYSGGWATLNWMGLNQWVLRNQEAQGERMLKVRECILPNLLSHPSLVHFHFPSVQDSLD